MQEKEEKAARVVLFFLQATELGQMTTAITPPEGEEGSPHHGSSASRGFAEDYFMGPGTAAAMTHSGGYGGAVYSWLHIQTP